MAQREISKHLRRLPALPRGADLPATLRTSLYRKLYARGYESQIISSLLNDSEQDFGGESDIDS